MAWELYKYKLCSFVLNTSSTIPKDISNLIYECSRCTGGMRIKPVHLETNSPPIFLKARPMAYGLREAVKSNLDSMVEDGILQPVTSSTWATPIVTPLKANGQPRVCGDFRISSVDDMFEGVRGCQVFSKIDLTHGFLQIPLDEESKELTTINTMWGLYQYNFLPFGLTVSPGIF